MPDTEPTPDPAQPRLQSSPWRRRLQTIAIAMVGALVLGRIALPFALGWAIPRIAADQNLSAEIGNIDLGLIRGEVTLDDLILDLPRDETNADIPLTTSTQTDDAPPIFGLGQLHVAFEWTDLLFGRLHITDLSLSEPTIRLTQLADGSLKLPAFGDSGDSGDPRIESEYSEIDTPAPDDLVTESQAGDSNDAWIFILDRFELNDTDIALRSEVVEQEVVRLGAERLGFDALRIGPDGIGLGGIDLDHPELFVERTWLLGLSQSPAESETKPENSPTPPGEMPSVQLSHVKIDRAEFTVHTEEGPVAVALQLDVANVSTNLGDTFPIDVGVEIDAAKIGLDGRLGLNPALFEGKIEWQNLSVPPFLLLAYPKLVPWLASCNAKGELHVSFHSVAENGPAGLIVSGTSNVSEMSFKHPSTSELAVEWNSLDIEIREVFVPLEPTAELQTRVEVSRVALSSPRIVYTNPPDALDELLDALAGEPAESPDDTTGNETATIDEETPLAPVVTIEELEVTDATIRYVDRSVKPTHETKIHQLRVALDSLATIPAPGVNKVSIDGLIQSAGSFKLRGHLPGGQGELHFSLSQLDLVSYNSLARAVGWGIETGTTSLDTTIVVAGESFKTKNKIVLHDLDVAPEDESGFSSRFGMSVDLILALLRDPSGDIPLSVPVTVDDEGAGVEIGPIVLSAVRNAIQGAIASPLKMLGMLVPKSGESADALTSLPFPPGDAEVAPDTRSQLESIVEFIDSRPMLSLTLRGHWSPEDRLPTAMKILEEKVVSGDDFPKVEDTSFFSRRRVAAALSARARSEPYELSSSDAALLERYVTAQEVTEERLRALADSRSASIQAALVELGAPTVAISVGIASASSGPSVSLGLDSSPERVAELTDSSAP